MYICMLYGCYSAYTSRPHRRTPLMLGLAAYERGNVLGGQRCWGRTRGTTCTVRYLTTYKDGGCTPIRIGWVYRNGNLYIIY